MTAETAAEPAAAAVLDPDEGQFVRDLIQDLTDDGLTLEWQALNFEVYQRLRDHADFSTLAWEWDVFVENDEWAEGTLRAHLCGQMFENQQWSLSRR